MLGPDRAVHGGISALVNSYFEAGIDKKADIKYIGTMKEGSRLKKLVVAGCAYLRFLFSLPKYDIVHVHFASDNSLMRKSLFIRTAARHGKKLVLHQHGGDFKNYYANEITEKRKKYIRDTLSLANEMLVLTEGWREYFSELVPAVRVEVLPNGVLTRGVAEDAPNKKNRKKLLFLGRICADKGVKELIEAVNKLHENDSETELYVGGIYEDLSFKEMIEGAGEHIRYIGWVSGSEKDRYLDECGIYVLPSYYEGMPVSVIEAMLHGCVVIASAVGGIPEIIEDGRDGILIEPRSSEGIKNAAQRVMDDPEYADKLSGCAVKKAKDNYSIDVILDRLLSVYSNI